MNKEEFIKYIEGELNFLGLYIGAAWSYVYDLSESDRILLYECRSDIERVEKNIRGIIDRLRQNGGKS